MWQLAVELGDRTVAAAVSINGEVRPLRLAGRPHMPAAVFRFADGDLRTGWEAHDRGAANPAALIECPLESLTRGAPADEALRQLAAVIAAVAEQATTDMGSEPDSVVIAAPAEILEDHAEHLVSAARSAGIATVMTVSSAAATAAAVQGPGPVAVLEVGSARTRCAVAAPGEARPLAARSEPVPGGDAFDREILAWLLARAGVADGGPAVALLADDATPESASARLHARREVRAAREALADGEQATVSALPWTQNMTITRHDLAGVLAGQIQQCVDLLEDTIAAAGCVPGDLDAVLVSGEAAATPGIAEALTARLGVAVEDVSSHRPAALGAASLAPRPDGGTGPAEPVEEPEEPGLARCVSAGAAAVVAVLLGVGLIIGGFTLVDRSIGGEREPVVTAAEPEPPDEVIEADEPLHVDYDDEVRANFVDGCLAGGGDTQFCECVYEQSEERIPFERFVTIDQRVAVGGELMGTDMGWILIYCQDED